MSLLKRIGLFWYDFIVGDDWTMAAGVVISTTVLRLLVGTIAVAWLIPPIAVTGLLALSLGRAQRAVRSIMPADPESAIGA